MQEVPPMVCAHGGDAALVPPATMRAFLAAIDGGFRCVEVPTYGFPLGFAQNACLVNPAFSASVLGGPVITH